MSKVASVSTVTVKQTFPFGTVDTVYTVVVVAKADGSTAGSSTSTDGTAQFTLNAGDYTVTVSKNGVSASADFTIQADSVSLDVPATVTVSIA